MDVHYAIEKFTRCPRCRSFSLKHLSKPGEKERRPVYRCGNCENLYVVSGNNLKEISGSNRPAPPVTPGGVTVTPGEIPVAPVEKKIRAKAPEDVVIPVKVKRERRFSFRAAAVLVPFLCLLVAGILYLDANAKKNTEPAEISQVPVVEKDAGINRDTPEPSASPSLPTEPAPGGLTIRVPETPALFEEEPPGEETGTETDSHQPGFEQEFVALDFESLAEEPQAEPHSSSQAVRVEVVQQPVEKDVPPPAVKPDPNPGVYKVFDLSWIKVRSSCPEHADRSQCWYFKKKAIAVKRAETQKVYIAGDPTGRKKWAVDDEMIINGKRIKGFSNDMANTGYIPDANMVPPQDITHLVPPGRETVLNIKLADYGVYWGNTPVYVVVM